MRSMVKTSRNFIGRTLSVFGAANVLELMIMDARLAIDLRMIMPVVGKFDFRQCLPSGRYLCQPQGGLTV